MVETLEKIFKLLGVSKLLGYVFILILLATSSLGIVYIDNWFQEKSHKNRIVKDNEYLDKEKNAKEVRKILAKIQTDLYLYLDFPIESKVTPKINFDEIISEISSVIENNTYPFSMELKSSLIQIRHRINFMKLSDDQLEGYVLKSPYPSYAEDMKNFMEKVEELFNEIESYSASILEELNNIQY